MILTRPRGLRYNQYMRFVIGGLAVWLVFSSLFLLIVALNSPPNARATLQMALGLGLLWIGGGGSLFYRLRVLIRQVVGKVPLPWAVRFVLFATVLALLEEGISTGMTNAAPLFGVPVGAAYITASANYWDVVCCHSVVVFIPMFIAWAWLLKFWDFRPTGVFLLFGITGLLAETIYGGAQALLQFSFWIFTYGLMVYLSAESLPSRLTARRPTLWAVLLALLLPIVFAVPVALLVSTLHPISIHFPPIQN